MIYESLYGFANHFTKINQNREPNKLTEQVHTLIKGCKKDDRKAQFQLFDLYLPYVTVVVRRYLNDQNAVADLSQEIFITVFKNLKSSYDESKGSFKPWLRKIAIHKCLRHNKTNPVFSEMNEDIPEVSIDPVVFNNFSEEELMNLVQMLPEQFRHVFNLVIIDGYTHAEVGKILCVSVLSSRKKLSRAREWLSRKIKSSSSLFNSL